MPANSHDYEMRKLSAFADELRKLSEVSDEEAIDAAKHLSTDPRSRTRRYLEASAIGGVTKPGIDAVGELARDLATEGPQKFKNVRGALSRPSLARGVTAGVLGGTSIEAIRQGLQTQHAKKTLERFKHERLGDQG